MAVVIEKPPMKGRGRDQLLNLILEVTGQRDMEKEAKVSTAQSLLVPAVNNAGIWGRWAFVEITDPWNVKAHIQRRISDRSNS